MGSVLHQIVLFFIIFNINLGDLYKNDKIDSYLKIFN